MIGDDQVTPPSVDLVNNIGEIGKMLSNSDHERYRLLANGLAGF